MKKNPKSLDQYEADFMKDIENNLTSSDKEAVKRLKGKMIVDTDLKKSRPISLRISNSDLEGIQIRAAKAGIPYQTLIKSILHKVATYQIEL